ncbi:Uncharacterised protein [Klebsiella pneumoniae]|uniref:Uncharacterized protein n=1 Tax=Klebsiella pneumoniae TaxID=573 RepID=A0A378BFX8_KLEPN|nr:Uncharacterised protein [Klebsiella pneumoniae]
MLNQLENLTERVGVVMNWSIAGYKCVSICSWLTTTWLA